MGGSARGTTKFYTKSGRRSGAEEQIQVCNKGSEAVFRRRALGES